MQLSTTNRVGIALGVAAGASAAVITSDRALNGGMGSGALVPVTLGGATLGALALGSTSRTAWRWAGTPLIAGGAATALRPLAMATLGGALGLGVAVLTDRIWPASDGADPSGRTLRELDRQADDAASTADDAERRVESDVAEATEELDAARDGLDAAVEPHGGRMGKPGTVGEGRIDVSGLSPGAAADAVLDAYRPGHDELAGTSLVRVDGGNVFSITALVEHAGRSRDGLVAFFTNDVDTVEPIGTISAEEARAWQAGAFGEHRTNDAGGE